MAKILELTQTPDTRVQEWIINDDAFVDSVIEITNFYISNTEHVISANLYIDGLQISATNTFEKRNDYYKIKFFYDPTTLYFKHYLNKMCIELKFKHNSPPPTGIKVCIKYNVSTFDPTISDDPVKIKITNDIYDELIIEYTDEGYAGNYPEMKKPPKYLTDFEDINYVVCTFRSALYSTKSLQHAIDYADYINLSQVRTSTEALDHCRVYKCAVKNEIVSNMQVYESSWANIMKKERLSHLWWYDAKYQEIRQKRLNLN